MTQRRRKHPTCHKPTNLISQPETFLITNSCLWATRPTLDFQEGALSQLQSLSTDTRFTSQTTSSTQEALIAPPTPHPPVHHVPRWTPCGLIAHRHTFHVTSDDAGGGRGSTRTYQSFLNTKEQTGDPG